MRDERSRELFHDQEEGMPDKTKKSDTHHISTQSIVSDSYGSFLSEGYDSLDFFGFGLWQWQCWNPSLASRVTTKTDDDESSHALQKC